MRKAIISDIHGNVSALNRVLDDIRSQNITRILCLGDIFGSVDEDADIRCLDILMDFCSVCVLGNKDLEVILNKLVKDSAPEGAKRAYEKLREESPQNRRRWDFLDALASIHTEPDGTMFFHGSPCNPLQGYLSRNDLYDPIRIEYEFWMIHHLGFHGHTHIPEVINSEKKYMPPENAESPEWTFPKTPDHLKYFIGVGSVGEPRGENPRTAYAILEDLENAYRVQFRLLGEQVNR